MAGLFVEEAGSLTDITTPRPSYSFFPVSSP